MKYSKTISEKTKNLILENNGEVVNEDLQLLPSQINWNYKGNQTRAGDLDLGHKAKLSADIKSRGLIEKPLVMFDPKTKMYVPVVGHHRMSVLRSHIESEKILERIPCGEVKFEGEIDKQLFMQRDNDHPPAKAHTRDDAI